MSLSGGWFEMGANDGPHPKDGEAPVRSVWLDPYSIASTAVSNAAFAQFVDATGYVSLAEQLGYSFVFHLFVDADAPVINAQASDHTPWWVAVKGACWHSPFGPESSVEENADHPVVHICREDALAYCEWANSRLPTEAEWEYAARGGLVGAPYPWGHELDLDGEYHANIWQGDFPNTNVALDGYAATAPVKTYKPNGFGLYNMVGNVWEWTADRYTTRHSPRPTINPRGPLNGHNFVTKGGSYLCHESYCQRYRTSSRQSLAHQTTAGHLGFRVAGSHRVKTL